MSNTIKFTEKEYVQLTIGCLYISPKKRYALLRKIQVLYENEIGERKNGEEEIVTQSLLVPLNFTLNPQEIAICQANQNLFLELEFKIGLLNFDKAIVHRHPSLIS